MGNTSRGYKTNNCGLESDEEIAASKEPAEVFITGLAVNKSSNKVLEQK